MLQYWVESPTHISHNILDHGDRPVSQSTYEEKSGVCGDLK